MLFKNLVLLLLFNIGASLVSNELHEDDDEADPEMEKYLREALENFREQMKVGIEAISMPVLDPLELQDIDIQVKENLANMELKIKKMTASKLSSFNITKLNPNLEKLFLAINMSLPEIKLDGIYSVNGRLLRILPIYGGGDFQINVTDLYIAGSGALQYKESKLQLINLKLDLLWKHIGVYLENFLRGGSFSEVLQRAIPGVGRDVFINYKTIILEKLEKYLMREINLKLSDAAINDIISGIFPE